MARVAKKAYGQRTSMPTAMALEDTQKFGLGLTSVLVDYTHSCVKNLVEALNDTSGYGEISRSLLSLQAARTGRLGNHQLMSIGTHMLRIRQLSAVHQSNLRLINQELMQEYCLDGNQLTSILNAVNEDMTGLGLPPHIPLKVVQPLLALGVQCIDDITSRDGKYIISPTDLKRKYGKAASTSHTRALLRLAHLLAHEPAEDIARPWRCNAQTTRSDRRIHASYLRAMHANIQALRSGERHAKHVDEG